MPILPRKLSSRLSSQRLSLGLTNERGQGLIEYLVIVALMAVATIAIMSSLNKTLQVQFANVIYKLQGSSQRAQNEHLQDSDYSKKDFSNFMNDGGGGFLGHR